MSIIAASLGDKSPKKHVATAFEHVTAQAVFECFSEYTTYIPTEPNIVLNTHFTTSLHKEQILTRLNRFLPIPPGTKMTKMTKRQTSSNSWVVEYRDEKDNDLCTGIISVYVTQNGEYIIEWHRISGTDRIVSHNIYMALKHAFNASTSDEDDPLPVILHTSYACSEDDPLPAGKDEDEDGDVPDVVLYTGYLESMTLPKLGV